METSPVDEEYVKQIEEARRELRALMYKEKCAPLMLRLAWEDASTYDPTSQIVGGPNGSITNEKRPGLDNAIKRCEEVKRKVTKSKVSLADIFQLAGVVAVEVTGGPTIDFIPGRVDSLEAAQARRHPDSNLKSASCLRDIFTTRMGLSDQDIVALFGGHTLGGVRDQENTKVLKEQWTRDPSKFDNTYFLELLRMDKSLYRLPSESALVEDKKFRKYVEKYAQDEEAFFKDYAAAHKKLSELGLNRNVAPKKPKFKKPKGVMGIIVVSALVLAKMYFRKRENSRLKKN